jgi:catechol 2,3-dioxygenase-like lactoylglutathione lyase family enzyme
MAKIRHIAIRAEDVEAVASFYQQAFGLELVQRRPNGPIDLSDGDINLTILPATIGIENYAPGEIRPGYAHIGFMVEDEDETHRRLVELGATTPAGHDPGDHAYYEKKYRGVEGLWIDVGHWRGASPLESKSPVTAAD